MSRGPDTHMRIHPEDAGREEAIPVAPGSSLTMIEVRGLKKHFGFKPILRGVSLTVAEGERMALLGANGAGKTTLLRILAALTRADSGTVSIAGLDLARDPQQVRQLIGFVAHEAFIYEELTALENLLFFGHLYGVRDARTLAVELLQRVGLERRMQDKAGTFSRGMLQRLSWARALLHRPRVLLLDEPETGLDQEGHALIDNMLAEFSASGGTVLFTTHQLERALQLSDRLLLLQGGRVIEQRQTQQTTLAELQELYQRRVVR